ncbi:hypothetical protein GCM10010411_03170 [Actinomadura fulvescens]|uniref:Transposase n=1 Tax=Actinomadura fulvescens TaxID=46160 RepID=A0ABN3PAU9_9ACTN
MAGLLPYSIQKYARGRRCGIPNKKENMGLPKYGPVRNPLLNVTLWNGSSRWDGLDGGPGLTAVRTESDRAGQRVPHE